MKTNKDYILRKFAGEVILVPSGEASRVFNSLITLNIPMTFIWEHIDECKDEEELVAKVLDAFEVDEETARKDVYGFLKEARMVGMVVDE